MLSTKQAAEILGVSSVRVFQLIQEGVLPATKIGRDWFIKEEDLEKAKSRPGRGRPVSKKEEK